MNERTQTWLRRAAYAVAAIVALMLLAWAAGPAVIRSQVQSRASAALGRTVTLGEVSFKPWSLELDIKDITIAGSAPDKPLLTVARLYANAQIASVFRMAPVLKAVDIDRPSGHLTRTSPGHYDIDDVLAKLAQTAEPAKPDAQPARFALANLRINGGAFTFDDRPVKRVHRLEKLDIGVPFLSDLPRDVDVVVQPRVAFVLNGAAFDSGGTATPFAAGRKADFSVRIGAAQGPTDDLDLTPYLGYVPAGLPVQLERGRIGGDLKFAFAHQPDAKPSLVIAGTLTLADFSLITSTKATLFAGQRLTVPLVDVQPFANKVMLGAVTLDGADLNVHRDAQGHVNVATLTESTPSSTAAPNEQKKAASSAAASASGAASAPGTAPASAPWTVGVASIAISGGRIRWVDALTRAELIADQFTASAKSLQWPMRSPLPIELQTHVRRPSDKSKAPSNGRSTLRAKVDTASAVVDWTVEALPLATFAPYLNDVLVPQIGGVLAGQGKVDWAGGAKPHTRVEVAHAQLQTLSFDVAPSAAASAAAPAAAASTNARRNAGPRSSVRPLSWGTLDVAKASIDVDNRRVAIDNVALKEPSLRIERDRDGQWNVIKWLTSSSKSSTPSSSSAAPSTRKPAAKRAASAASAASVPPGASAPTGWQVTLRDLQLQDGQLRFVDGRPRPNEPEGLRPVRVRFSSLSLAAQNLSFGAAAAAPSKIKLSANLGRTVDANESAPASAGGKPAPNLQPRLEWTGELALDPLLARGKVRLVRAPVEAFERYVDNPLRIDLARADLSARGDFSVNQGKQGLAVQAKGDVRVFDFSLLALAGTMERVTQPAAGVSAVAARAGPTSPDELLRWRRLGLDQVAFSMAPGAKPQLDIAKAQIDDLYSRLVVTEEGRINVIDAARRTDGAASAAGAASAPSPAARGASSVSSVQAVESKPLPIDVRLGGTQLVNGRIDFADHFVKPNYSAALTELNGSLGAVTSGANEMAAIELKGRAEGSALLEISGKLNPFVDPLALDIGAKATDLELAPLSPYAAKYAGYEIERGKLSMNVHYRIDPDGHLEASNQVILNQLTFGERVESPQATKLPVRLAVALLRDNRGVIDLNLPVSGSLKDPQFSLVGLIGRVIGGVLVKALTSPFALLAGLGGDDANGPLSAIEFAPGTAALNDKQLANLDKIAHALAEKPALTLTITGTSDIGVEAEAYRRSMLEQRLVADYRRELQRANQAVEPMPAMNAETRARLLKQAYSRTDLPGKPRNVIGLTKRVSDDEMAKRLRDAFTVTPETIRELAVQRALAVRDALIAKGLKSDRLFLAAPKTDAAAGGAAPAVPAAVAAEASAVAPALAASSPSAGAWTPRAQLSLQAK